MPRHRTLKSLFVDVVVFVGMFALLGHLSINFWERFIIQTELTSMKTSLNSLKDTINKIGFAYDTLHQELIGIAEITQKKLSPSPNKHENEPSKCKEKYCCDQLIDIQLQTIGKTKNHTTLTPPLHFNKTIQSLMETLMMNKTTQNVREINVCYGKNMSTGTRYPPKSTGVGNKNENCLYNCPGEDYCKYRTNNAHRNHKQDIYYNPANNWRF